MNNIKKLAWVGAQGSAKTTTVNRIYTMLEKLGFLTYKIPETARMCPFPINEKTTILAQLWMINRQLSEELIAYKYLDSILNSPYDEPKPRFILCDRSIYDPVIYSRSAVKHGNMTKEEMMMVEETVKQNLKSMQDYDHIFLCEPKPLYDDGTRSTDEAWQKEIYSLWKEYVKEKGLKVTVVQ